MTVVSLEAHRAATIGGSEAAAACGVDPYRSRVMLWAEKTGRVTRKTGEAAHWGNVLQPLIAEELERRGWPTMPAPADGFRDDERPWLTGHPDGFTEVDGLAAILEIKTAGPWAGRQWQEDGAAPIPYLLQLQHYFELTGYSVGLLACLVAGQRLELRVVHRDDAVIETMLELEGGFRDFVVRDTPPPPDGSESAAAALAALHPASVSGEVVRLTGDEWADFRTLKARREQRDTIGRQVDELEQRLKARMGNAEEAVSPHDEVVARWTSYERTTIDTKALRNQRPDIAAEYSTAKTLRRLTLE
jgi:putative phage-type endonuclease